MSVALDIARGLCLFSDREGPFCYQKRNVRNVKNSKLADTAMTKFFAIVADVSDLMTPSHLRFCCAHVSVRSCNDSKTNNIQTHATSVGHNI